MNSQVTASAAVAPTIPETEDDKRHREWQIRSGRRLVAAALAKRLVSYIDESVAVRVVEHMNTAREAKLMLDAVIHDAVEDALNRKNKCGM